MWYAGKTEMQQLTPKTALTLDQKYSDRRVQCKTVCNSGKQVPSVQINSSYTGISK